MQFAKGIKMARWLHFAILGCLHTMFGRRAAYLAHSPLSGREQMVEGAAGRVLFCNTCHSTGKRRKLLLQLSRLRMSSLDRPGLFGVSALLLAGASVATSGGTPGFAPVP